MRSYDARLSLPEAPSRFMPAPAQELNLANNTLGGQVPPGTGMPQGLFELHLEGNTLEGKGLHFLTWWAKDACGVGKNEIQGGCCGALMHCVSLC